MPDQETFEREERAAKLRKANAEADEAESKAWGAWAQRWGTKLKWLAIVAAVCVVSYIGYSFYNGASSFLSFSWANPSGWFQGEAVETVSAREEDNLELNAIAALAVLKAVPVNPDYAAYGTWRATTFRGADGRICDMTINEQLFRTAAHAEGKWIKINDGETLALHYEDGQWIPSDMTADESARWADLLAEIQKQCGQG